MTNARKSPPRDANEREMLDGWLEFHRATLLWKCEGVPPERLSERSVPPSNLSLLGLVRHMAEVENGWFREVAGGEADAPNFWCSEENPDADLDDVDSADVAESFAAFDSACRRSREIAAGIDDLDTLSPNEHRGRRYSLRWIYTHMIEEYARHNGHADLIREAIDGATGS